MNVTFDKVPIDRLTVGDVRARPGGVVAVVLLGVLVLVLVVHQVVFVIRPTGLLPRYLFYYVVGGGCAGRAGGDAGVGGEGASLGVCGASFTGDWVRWKGECGVAGVFGGDVFEWGGKVGV